MQVSGSQIFSPMLKHPHREIEMVSKDKVEMRKQASGGRKRGKDIEIVGKDKVEIRKRASGGGRKRDKDIETVVEDKVEISKQAPGCGRKRDKGIEIVGEDKVEMRKQASGVGRKRDKEIEILGEDKVEMTKQASRGRERDKEIEIVREDKVEMRKQASGGGQKGAGASSLTSLPLPAGCVYIEFRDCLPSVTFRTGSWRADVVLEDPEGKEWTGIYHDNLGFHLLLAQWDKITAENGIQPGDELVFRVADASLNKYKFHVAPKLLEN